MTDSEIRALQADLEMMRTALGEIEAARAEDMTADELAKLQVYVETMRAEIIKELIEIKRVLVGNDGTGVGNILDSIIKTVETMGHTIEAMGRVAGEMNYERQATNVVIDQLKTKINMESILFDLLRGKEIGNMSQLIATMQKMTPAAQQ